MVAFWMSLGLALSGWVGLTCSCGVVALLPPRLTSLERPEVLVLSLLELQKIVPGSLQAEMRIACPALTVAMWKTAGGLG